MSKNYSEKAFPSLNAEMTGIDGDGNERFSVEPSGVISIRQYYAAKAMEKLLEHLLPCLFGGLDGAEDALAKSAFNIADAMIAFERDE